jgi:hypothetical protein
VSFVEGLRCRECGRAYPAEALHVCEYCFGPLEVVYDYEAVAATTSRASIAAGPASIWRYELSPSGTGRTLLRHSFVHGPGASGARDHARRDPASLPRRLDQLRHNMTATLIRMTGASK